ncbi:HAE1 family hydrophobic/amphiphilic exporter-1 [Oikeobacillus pervagus]|uniref:HAE1 family hydrophobic/amphiphilic exporter-1 n=1 Tax=Oikeobacillus pervagus TaxID=1325931 RepID=A0AAJ1WIK5_9BACI|nr:efflux RND transporter permease subunit [Oikeobacillus pervagus]MDQ0214438.1 HAE1 family hydrophobic/amphiphilic exporter-1 [Oikeobacillus pervagus]
MNLLKFIVQRKILIGLMVVLIMVFGSIATLKLDKELLPDVGLDGAFVEISAGEMSAIEVERTITNPIEQKVKALDGVESIHSTTNIGQTSLQMTFERGRGEELIKEVEAIVNATKSENSAITDAFAAQFGGSQSYEFFLDVSDGDMSEMTSFAKNILKPRLEQLPEVREVSLSGVVENEVIIEFDRDKIIKNGLDISQVIHAIGEINSESTLGELNKEKESPTLRWDTKLENIEDIKNIRIPSANGSIELKEVANVSLQPKENSSYVWKNGTQDFIFIQVGRTSEFTQIQMAEAIRTEIQKIRDENLVKDFTLNELVAQADYVQDSIDGVTSNILIGGLIAIVVLLLFLRNIRATFIIGLSIPTSVFLTFATMWVFGYSFNMLTLIGLGLGIGMMVDASIVILESIYKKKEQGMASLSAVLEGTKEVAAAVIASMLTTIVVFLPIGLMGGDAGKFTMMLSAVVAITLISSVIIAFTLIPSLSEKILKLRKQKKREKRKFLQRSYNQLVSWTIKKKRHSFAIITLFFLMFVGSLLLVTKIPMAIMPDMYNRYSELMVDLETGVSMEEKRKIAKTIDEKLSSIEDVESNYVINNGDMFFTLINMTKGEDIKREQKEVNEEILKSLRNLDKNYPVEGVQNIMSGGGGSPVQVNIKGESFEKLQEISGDVEKKLQEIEGIVGVKNSMERTSEEQVIQLKQGELKKAGLSQLQIKQFLEQAFLQMPIGNMTFEDEEVPIATKWKESTETKTDLLDIKIPTANGEKKLSDFVELKKVETPNEISHVDGERFMSISADIEGKDLGTINREVQKLIEKYDSPTGYTVSIAGDLEQQQELIKEMILILAIALFLVYFVMAVQFNHLGHPLIVMSVIPMTIVGVILGLFITQMELSIMSGMGIIMLIGIVLNNAILLIDRTNQLRNQGYTVEDALVEAGNNRIRPIFMTTLTTAGGMLPLALASGTASNYQAPMATVIISGLMFATLITLLLIPAVYRLFTTKGTSKKKKKKEKMEIPV